MKVATSFFLCVAVTTWNVGYSQNSQSDSQTLQNVLLELRAIHADLRLSQTTQILVTEWQLQQANVNTALLRRDNLRRDITETETEEKSTEEESAQVEQEQGALGLDPSQKRDLAEREAHLRSQLKALKARAQALSDDLQDAILRLRNEQSTLDSIQSQLSDVVKKLQPSTSP